ncbi:zinc finger and BTB domain-containing protein 21 [Denticeps clupeoides]|uniref:Zinc finger and BTB domain-containing protein 21 n=1 Tax=Denticeps clupeoides TaxID=299321 RepID=A0AAY4AF81_9TELE|nr:zinc finger and BTB domain-containing protein 21 [Denticeps clupeoides]
MDNLVHYSNPAHAVSLLAILNEQRLRGQLCDVVLVVGDQRYQAHRSVLAASSEYFHSLFSRRDAERSTIVQLDFCEPDAFEIVLNYIYTCSLFVDKCSLAAVQELGYSLGIPFLTNIMSIRPQVSYCITRKKISYTEDDSSFQQRSVIVCHGRDDPVGPDDHQWRGSNHQGKTPKQRPHPASQQEACAPSLRELNQTSRHVRPSETERSRSVDRPGEDNGHRSINSALASIMKGRLPHGMMSVRPQLTSSVSFSESQIQRASLQPESSFDLEEKKMDPLRSKAVAPGQQAARSQTVDRSGPLIKSLLRRSLSMDSPVPVFSPALELKDPQAREQSVVKMATKATETKATVEQNRHQASQSMPPLILRSRTHNLHEREDTQETRVRVKTEPSSPLADPSDIIRITVGDSLPVNLRDLQMNFEEGPRGYFNHSGKRKPRVDCLGVTYKKQRLKDEHHFTHKDSTPPHNSNADVRNEEPGELRPNKMFKCWNCLKVFRSNTGLYRHVNMYHNPEKPYACSICHKRFHTNFKVWTHCQTQHGIVQNPAPSSSSYSGLDEKFQRKLVDIVREREIKKALIMKLRRNKQNLQPQPFTKKGFRLRSTYVCPYCRKMFWFQSQFKQHLKMHATETGSPGGHGEDGLQKPEQEAQAKENQGKEVYSCKLCNEKLSSPIEQGDHERGCRHATVCPYCGLRFSSPLVKRDHEAHCNYKKLTCLECMRTFKSSFSIWRHQVEVHNHNMMTVKEQLSLSQQESNGKAANLGQGPPHLSQELVDSREDSPAMFDSEDSSSFVPEDLSMAHQGELQIKEEPQEEAVSERGNGVSVSTTSDEPGVWPCEKCGKLFSSHKDLERHQELLCHIKPFICHICHKAFRTNFRLWSHYQSHMASLDEPGEKEPERRMSSPSPSPPPAPQLSPPNASCTTAASGDESGATTPKGPDLDRMESLALPTSDPTDKSLAPQESETLFYHAPTLSAITFKRQYMCKLCHRTFKTAFSLWSHEQSHSHL